MVEPPVCGEWSPSQDESRCPWPVVASLPSPTSWELKVLAITLVPPPSLSFRLSRDSCRPPSQNTRQGRVLAAATSPTEPPTPTPRAGPRGRSVPAARRSGMCSGFTKTSTVTETCHVNLLLKVQVLLQRTHFFNLSLVYF